MWGWGEISRDLIEMSGGLVEHCESNRVRKGFCLRARSHLDDRTRRQRAPPMTRICAKRPVPGNQGRMGENVEQISKHDLGRQLY